MSSGSRTDSPRPDKSIGWNRLHLIFPLSGGVDPSSIWNICSGTVIEMNSPKIKRALISVSNKLGIVDFAQGLVNAGVEIYSTGGTRRHLEHSGISVIDVAEYTQFPEMMDGRVKTLHKLPVRAYHFLQF